MKQYFKVSFKYSENVYCSNIAHAETAADVEAHYSKYEWVSVSEAAEHEVTAAQRKGMPIVEVEHTEPAEEATESTAAALVERMTAKVEERKPRQRFRGFSHPVTWHTPAGEAPNLCLDILKQPHTLIAGATGSGKSVLINSVIYTALYSAPSQVAFILIDPKGTELVDYENLPHTVYYGFEPAAMVQGINGALRVMEARNREMHRLHQKETTEQHIYLIVDEFADLMTTLKDQTLKPLCRIAQLGRAAHIHLIAATQRPTRDIINGQIKVNIDSRVALRCPTAQDSRNIINTKGAETLPRVGFGYYLTPDTMQAQLVNIPFIEETELQKRVEWWEAQNKKSLFQRLHR